MMREGKEKNKKMRYEDFFILFFVKNIIGL